MFCLCTLLGAGCSDDGAAPGDGAVRFDAAVTTDTGADDTGGTTDAAPDQSSGLMFNGEVRDVVMTSVVANAKVCLLPDKQVCGTSAASGKVYLLVPASGLHALAIEASGYTSQVYLIDASSLSVSTAPYFVIGVNPSTATTLFFSAAGVTLDKTKGILAVAAGDSEKYGAKGVAGLSFTVSPSPGSATIYMNDAGAPDTTLTATSSTGFGVVANLAPGDYEVTFSHATKSCALISEISWPGTTATSAKVRILADHSTGIAVVCK